MPPPPPPPTPYRADRVVPIPVGSRPDLPMAVASATSTLLSYADARDAQAEARRLAKDVEKTRLAVEKQRKKVEEEERRAGAREEARVAKEREVEAARLAKAALAEAKRLDKEREAEASRLAKAALAEAKRMDKEREVEAARLAKAALAEAKRLDKEREMEAARLAREREADAKRREKEAKDREREAQDRERRERREAEAAERARVQASKALEKDALDRERQLDRTVREWLDKAHARYREALPYVKPFASEFACLACGLDERDGFDAARLAKLPTTSLKQVLDAAAQAWRETKTLPEDFVLEALAAFQAQVKRVSLWVKEDRLLQQGDRGFNRHATRVLEHLGVDGARTCTDADDKPMMLQQATTAALFHPLTPIHRALVVHPTGTGKSRVLLQVLENYYHDPRPKVVFAPTHIVLLQIVQDLLLLLPASSSRLRMWHTSWHEEQSESVKTSPDYLWHVMAALSFRRIKHGVGVTSSSTTRHEDDFLDEVQHDTGEADDDVRAPVLVPERNRVSTLTYLREGKRSPSQLNATHELRAPIVFLTYADHKLGTYRDLSSLVFSGDPQTSVSYDDTIVLVDEMHNLFDERNPNINAMQRRKRFGDKALRDQAQERLAAATDATQRRRALDNAKLYEGLARLLKQPRRAVVVGLTATPLVDLHTEGTRAARKVLEWVRGKKAAQQKQTTTGSDTEEGEDNTFEGYVSYFGTRPPALFAAADELSFPLVEPVVVRMPADDLRSGEDDQPPQYGLGRLRALQQKYEVARAADEWFKVESNRGWYAPKRGTKDTVVDYWPKSGAWTSYTPTLHETPTRMPEWGEGLVPFGRSLPTLGQAAWLDVGGGSGGGTWRETRRPCWIRGRVQHARGFDVTVGDTDEVARVLGTGGKVDVTVALLHKPVLNAQDDDGTGLFRSVKFVDAHNVLVVTHDGGKHTLPLFPLSLVPGNASRLVLTLGTKDVVEGVHGNASRCDVLVFRRRGKEDVCAWNASLKPMPQQRTALLTYEAALWYYEEEQLFTTYAGRLDRFKQDEGARWTNVFYGGRELRAAQGTAAKDVPCTGLGGIHEERKGDEGTTTTVKGFAVDMARHIVRAAMAEREGKVLWLLGEAHGLALVEKWLHCDPSVAPWRDRIHLLGAYRQEDRAAVQTKAKRFLTDVFNAPDNLRGERCKLFIGGAGDLGVGVTFTEVRHIYLDLTANYFSLLQQMGRGLRLCKHDRLTRDVERTLAFHLPVPVLTTGWGGEATDATSKGTPGGLGALSVTMDGYEDKLRVAPRRKTIEAPLHVPRHAFDTLVDLQRARVQFLTGMQRFADVAVDAAYYQAVAGWETPRFDPTQEKSAGAAVQAFVRERVLRGLQERSAFAAQGLRVLQAESKENAAFNREVLARPENDAAKTRTTAAEQAYRDAVRALRDKDERQEEKERKRVEAERKRVEADRKRVEADRKRVEADRDKERKRLEKEEKQREADSKRAAAAMMRLALEADRARREEERREAEREKQAAKEAREAEKRAREREKEREKERREAERRAEEGRVRDCRNYRFTSHGTLKRTDRSPSFKVNQEEARRVVHEGARRGDAHCVQLFQAMYLYEQAMREVETGFL